MIEIAITIKENIKNTPLKDNETFEESDIKPLSNFPF